MESNRGNSKFMKRFSNLYYKGECFSSMLADVGVAHLPGENENVSDNEDVENVDVNSMSQLQCVDIKIEPTPPCNSAKNALAPLKLKRQSIKHKIEESTPTIYRRRSKQMRPRVILAPDYFATLSDEVVLQIFKWLPRQALMKCTLTCRRLRRLAYDECFWRSLNLGGKNITPEVVQLIINRGLVSLRLSKADMAVVSAYANVKFDPSFVCQELCTTKLQNLDLSMATISPQGIVTILTNCTTLKNVSLEHCEIDDTVCNFLGQNKELQQLNMALCSNVTAKGLEKIFKNCPKLDALNLGWVNLNEEAIETVASHLPTFITKLNLSGCRDFLSDKHVKKLVTRCAFLEELDLSDASQLTGNSLKTVVDSLNHLRILSLSRCFHINPQYYSLISHISQLTNLNVFGLFTNEGVQFLKCRYPSVGINQLLLSTIARPTTGLHRTSIWGHKVYE